MKFPLKNNKKFYLLGLVLFFYGLLVIPLIVINNQNRQESRGRADTITPTGSQATCGNAPTDTVIIIDRSGSMFPANKLPPTKTAAKNFVDVIAQDSRNKVSLVTFSTTAKLDSPLTSDYASVKSKIDSIQADGFTCLECALKLANQEIATDGRAGIKKVIVILTDGESNYIDGSSSQVSTAIAGQKAIDAATNGYTASKTQYFTIGLGDPNATGDARFFNPDLLKQIAAATAGQFYFPLPDQLSGVYNDISLLIGKANVNGFVFNDANGNGVYDTGEAKLPNWTVQLISQSGATKTVTTDANGAYIFTGVCDGPYTIHLVPQSGWAQTLPADPNGYSTTIQNGFSVVDKEFGVKVAPPTPTTEPTATPAPTALSDTTLALTVLFDGIGSRGDNSNPTESSLSNKNPLHNIIQTDVQIFDSNNQQVASTAGVVTFNPSDGTFKGNLTLPGGTITQGQYTVKVKATRYLRKLVPGIQTIIPGQVNNITPVALVAGDINNDNRLNILDYNLLLDCYSDLLPASNCSN